MMETALPHTPYTSSIVRAIRRLREHSRSCHNLATRQLLIGVERRMIEFLPEETALSFTKPGAPAAELSATGS
jgi:hypothetical protein